MMRVLEVILVVLLILNFLQALAKFTVHAFAPYDLRIKRIASYYAKNHRVISWFDTVTLIVMVVLVVLLFLTDMRYLSFVTGLVVGMSIIQVYFHRFMRPLPADKMPPEEPIPPIKHVSYAIQAQPGLAWKEMLLITVMSVWALFMLVKDGLFG